METSQKKSIKKRYFEVDVVKAFAFFFMIFVHTYEQLSSIDYYSSLPDNVFRNVVEFLGGPLAAPVFMFSMGIGMIFTRHSSPADFAKRGLKLLLVGYILNILRTHVYILIMNILGMEPNAPYTVLDGFFVIDILQFAGLSFILIALFKKIKINSYGILCISLLMLAAGSLTISATDPPDILSMLLGHILYTGKTCAFPLTLWLIYPAAGMVFAEMLRKEENRTVFYRNTLIGSSVILVSAISNLLFTGYDIRNMYALFDDVYYLQSFNHIIFTIPIVLIFLSLSYFLFRKLENTEPGKFIIFCSVNLNTVYIIQWLIIIYIDIPFSALGIEPFGEPLVIPAGLVIAAASIGIAFLWTKVRGAIRSKKMKGSAA